MTKPTVVAEADRKVDTPKENKNPWTDPIFMGAVNKDSKEIPEDMRGLMDKPHPALVATMKMANSQVAGENSQVIPDALDKINERLDKMAKAFGDLKKQMDNPHVAVAMPIHSTDIGQISLALSKARKLIMPVGKSSSSNRGKFSSMEDMEEAVLEPLEKHELAVIPSFMEINKEKYVVMTLSHSSNQWFKSYMNLHEAGALMPQESIHKKIGAAEKSLRRYMLRNLLNLSEESE